MKLRGTICQILSDNNKAFINFDEETDGKVSVWGCRDLTVLAFMKYAWFIFNFENQDYLQEWVENESSKYEKIMFLDSLEMQ